MRQSLQSKSFYLLILLMAIALTITLPLAAQDDETVYVTTQDYVALRLGPGVHWERLTAIDYGVTLRVTGRTVNTDWLQVAYENPLPPDASPDATIDGITYGWISTRYLVWRGNLLLLPLDGVRTVATARRAGPQLLLTPDTAYYTALDFSTKAGIIRNPQFVELTGRIGSTDNGYFWIQFQLNGEYYWTATWYTDPPRGYRQVLDASYLFPFGRVFNAIVATVRETNNKSVVMQQRWQDLNAGFAATCNSIPATIILPDVLADTSDLAREPIFNAPFNALASATANVNVAINQLEAVCNRAATERFATPEDITIALDALRESRLQLNVLGILLDPIGTRNPIANNE